MLGIATAFREFKPRDSGPACAPVDVLLLADRAARVEHLDYLAVDWTHASPQQAKVEE